MIGSNESRREPTYQTAPEEAAYVDLLHKTRSTFDEISKGERLFTTDVEGLWETFINNLPRNQQHYNCNACRRFITKYGGLVVISERGEQIPAMWDYRSSSLFFGTAVAQMERQVRLATVTGEFFSKETAWGTPVTGEWRHLHVIPRREHIYYSRVLSASQRMAEKLEDFKMLSHALGEFTAVDINQAVTLLKNEMLYRANKVVGVAEWFANVKQLSGNNRGKNRSNILWRVVANAPVGFCHIRTSMIGSLLEDIRDGYSLEVVKDRFNKKMNPNTYQRPQAAPTRGNTLAAERLVAKMGIERSLDRRYATMGDIQAIWKERVTYPTGSSGIFAHVPTKQGRSRDAAEIRDNTVTDITMDKFLRTVLPQLEELEVRLTGVSVPLGAYVTAAYPDSPPILQWDSPELRNPASHYIYLNGSTPRDWGLDTGWNTVRALSLQPHMWNPLVAANHHGKGVMMVISGANDKRSPGNALFPEILKAELREVRATIESYSRTAKIEKVADPICGLLLQEKGTWGYQIKAKVDGATRIFNLDRWD